MAVKTSKAINNSLLNIITPQGVDFMRTKVFWGENTAKVFGITKYPPELVLAWASRISNLVNVILCQVIEPTEGNLLVTYYSRSLLKYRAEAESARDPLIQHTAEKRAIDSEILMKYLSDNKGTVCNISNFIMIFGRTDEQLDFVYKELESTTSLLHCRIRLLANLQQEALKAVSPYNIPSEELLSQTRRNVPMPTYVGGFPFASNGFIDEDGYFLGVDSHNAMIAVDFWKREQDRTNSNMVIMGIAGQGKSALKKNLEIKEYMQGTVIISIDPEREDAFLAKRLGGDVVQAGGGPNKINPLQVRTVPMDDDEDEEMKLFLSDNMSPLALHLKTLEIFFQLYMTDINGIQLALLEQLLIRLYEKFNMHWETDFTKLKNTDYPTFKDLYQLMGELETSNPVEQSFKEDMKFIKLMIYKLAFGADQFIWSGHTTIDPQSDFIVLDTLNLQNQPDNVKRSQYFLLLTWAWERMSRNREEKVMLFADEAYLMIDPKVPQSLGFLRNISKRARKYQAGLCVVSHSVVDFLSDSVRMYGQALLDIASYKFLFGTDGQNLKDLESLYNLSEAEREFLLSKQKEHALFIPGSRRFITHVVIRPENLARIGKGGGK